MLRMYRCHRVWVAILETKDLWTKVKGLEWATVLVKMKQSLRWPDCWDSYDKWIGTPPVANHKIGSQGKTKCWAGVPTSKSCRAGRHKARSNFPEKLSSRVGGWRLSVGPSCQQNSKTDLLDYVRCYVLLSLIMVGLALWLKDIKRVWMWR